jgi:hypothetical protein
MSDPSTTPTPAPAPENDRETYLKGFENLRASFASEVATIRKLIDAADGHGLAPVVAGELRIRLETLQNLYAISIDMAANLHVSVVGLANNIASKGTEAVLEARAKVLTPPSAN